MNRITSVEVARAAGVSQSAVSRAYTPGASVSDETLAKVHAAADRLGYRPNALARSLITGESKIIGLVVAYLENQFYPEALERLSHGLQQAGYHILVFMASNDTDETEQVMADLLDYQVDGLIAASVAMTVPLAERCRSRGIPVLLFNRHQGDNGPSSVASDNFAGGRRIAELLAGAGHERIAHISGWQGSSTGRERQAGFLAGLAAAGRRPAACVDGRYNREAAQAATRAMFASGAEPPDALFVGNDHMAFGVMDVLRSELGMRVPEDVSVIGFDDVPIASWPAYDLTTMRQPLNRMIEAAIENLIASINDPDTEPVQIRIGCELCVRSSARLPEQM